MRPLIADSKTTDETLGFILSLALRDFSVSGIFVALRSAQNTDDAEAKIGEFHPRLGLIRQPGAILLLWNLVPQLTSPPMRYGSLKLFDQLSRRNHRNQAVLSTLGLVKSLFDWYYLRKETDPKERQALQRLLRRLLDMGATTREAKRIFQNAVKNDETLDTEVLEIIRAAIRARWPEHFSMEGQAALVLTDENMKGLPFSGCTFMVKNSLVNTLEMNAILI